MAIRGEFQKVEFMIDIFNLAKAFPNLCITVNATDLERFGVELLNKARSQYETEVAERIAAESDRTLMTAKEVASYFSVSTRTVTRWRKAGYLTPVYIGGITKYRRGDCKRLLETNEGRAEQ